MNAPGHFCQRVIRLATEAAPLTRQTHGSSQALICPTAARHLAVETKLTSPFLTAPLMPTANRPSDLPRAPFPGRRHLLLAAAAFGLFSLYGSLVPFTYHPTPWSQALRDFARLDLMRWPRASRVDLATNVLLFIPIGFFSLGTWLVDKKSRWLTLVAVAVVLPACAALSLVNEFTQLWFPPRVPSASDIQANTLGALTGMLLWIAIGQPTVNWLRDHAGSSMPQQNRALFLTLFTVALVGYSLFPFDLTIHPVELLQKFKAGRIELVPFSTPILNPFDFWSKQFLTVLLYLPVGAWGALVRRLPAAGPRSLIMGTLIGLCVVCGIEALQLFVNSRHTSATEAVFGGIGVFAGVWGTRRVAGSEGIGMTSEERPLALRLGLALTLAGYCLYLCVHFWWPLELLRNRLAVKKRLRHFFNVPFSSMQTGSMVEAFSDLLQKLLVFTLLGILCAAVIWSFRLSSNARRIWTGVLWVCCVVFVAGIEIGQSLFPPRVPDVTDVLLASAGVSAGLFIMGRILGSSDSSAT